VDLDIFPGRIIGLLGPNGCGKSTLIRHMIGLYLPTDGTCITFGCDAAKLGPKELSRIGYVHQEGELLDWMNVGQLIRYVSAYYINWNKDLEARYIHDFEIELKDRVGALSPGQRQKLAILLAIGHNPDLLILDEPASAFDPIARARFLDLLLKIIQQEGKTILISSHILSDVEKIIDHVIIMKSGSIIRDSSFDDLREQYTRVRLTSIDKTLPEKLPFEGVLSCQRNNGQAVMTIEAPDLNAIRHQAESLNCTIEIHPIPLEDIYKIVMDSKA
jgi:ABC-2 type transport system ATP-binding protein